MNLGDYIQIFMCNFWGMIRKCSGIEICYSCLTFQRFCKNVNGHEALPQGDIAALKKIHNDIFGSVKEH